MSLRDQLARLLFPAIRWDSELGFEPARPGIERALELGVGGFIFFGGSAPAVAELITELRARSRHPVLIGADLERGAGQQFTGLTPLPPLAAIGALDDLEITRRAGELTAREAVGLGIDWVYAPVADLDIEPDNPIVGTRSFGSDPDRVADQVVAWIEGCRAGGALASVKHFPGHGRTTNDSHITLPIVEASAAELEQDLIPFRAAIRAGVESVMTAHISFPALDPSGAPATLSPRIITGLLRSELGFDGLVVTDALIMSGVRGAGPGSSPEVAAIAAGCDILLYPQDPEGVLAALDTALEESLPESRVAEALARLDHYLSGRVTHDGGGLLSTPSPESPTSWAEGVGVRTIGFGRGSELPAWWSDLERITLVTIDDDLGGPYPPPARTTLSQRLREGGLEVAELGIGEPIGSNPSNLVIAIYADIRGWKGRPGLSEGARTELANLLEAEPEALLLLFGHPRLIGELPDAGGAVITGWGGEHLMQGAMANWLLRAD